MMKSILGALVLWSVAAAPAFAGAVEDMLETDRAFAAMAQEEGVPAAFAAYAAEDVRMLPNGAQPYMGRELMIADFADWPENASMTWTPVEGMASKKGDFGFTWGRYVYTGVNAEGEEIVAHGKYVSIWRKEKNGDWKFVVDVGNSNPAPEETP